VHVSLSDVPIEIRRVAAQHLESLHGTEIAAGADDAHLGPTAVPVYRPDVEGIAYYELSVVGAGGGRATRLLTHGFAEPARITATTVRRSKKATMAAAEAAEAEAGTPIGFVVATNGRHDFPIAHWSLDRLPPSHQVGIRRLEQDDDCEPSDGATAGRASFARLYRLDALAYAAESEAGELIGQTGQLPGVIVGLPHSLSRHAGQIATATATPVTTRSDDSSADGVKHRVERTRDEVPKLERSDEGGWPALKERYADTFGPLLDQLKDRAARAWELEDAIREFGEGIHAGTTHRVALLDEAEVELDGEGTKLVDASLEQRRAGPPVLVLRAADGPLAQEATLEVHLRYSSGEEEHLRFFVVSRGVPSNTKAQRADDGQIDCEE
jgi:hypothetical protein